jgi:hypothetical protein
MSEPGIVKHDRALGAIDPKPTVFQSVVGICSELSSKVDTILELSSKVDTILRRALTRGNPRCAFSRCLYRWSMMDSTHGTRLSRDLARSNIRRIAHQ